jgi:hypothetical protein
VKILKIFGTIVVLLVSWFVLWVALNILIGNRGLLQPGVQTAAVSAVVVFFGYWFVHTGRLAKMFRKV